MTERELWGYFGKDIIAHLKNSKTVKGHATYFTKAIDNYPREIACIGIPYGSGIISIDADEIKSIEIVQND